MAGIIKFLQAMLARIVLKVDDPDAAAAALAKETERKAREAARAKARRQRQKIESADSGKESADSPKTSAYASADSAKESADSSKTSEISACAAAAPPVRPASLSKNLDSLKEREKGKGGVGEKAPLPPDFQPNERGRALAQEREFDVRSLAHVVTKFRDWYADDPKPRTSGQWQRLFQDWLKTERPDSPRLPLMQVVTRTVVPIAQLPLPDDAMWAPVYALLKAEFGEGVAASWFSRCRLAIDGKTATVSLPTRFLASYIEGHFRERVLCAITVKHPGASRLRFVVGATGRAPGDEAKEAS